MRTALEGPRRRWRRLRRLAPIAVIVAATVGSARPHPQDPPPPSTQQPPVFRTGVNLVRVDVSVIDRRGTPIAALTADDFEVYEDGEAQTITSFKFIEADGEATDDLSLPIRSPAHAAAEAARDDVRVFLLFWDEYHINPIVSAVRSREALTRFVLEAFGPTDLVAFMDPLLPLDAIRFTRDRRELAEHVRKLEGRLGIFLPPRSLVEENHLRGARGRNPESDIQRLRCQVTMSAVKAGLAYLGTLREGRKSLILVTEGFGPCRYQPAFDLIDLLETPIDVLQDLTRSASDTNTAIHVVSPRGLMLPSEQPGFLRMLAAASGGEMVNTNDMGAAFRRAVTQASAFYLLGYPKEAAMDGRFHEIKVRVRRPGLEVRARAGYWAPLAADVERAKAAIAAAELPPAVAEAFSTLTPLDAPHVVEIWAGTAPAADGLSTVTLAWTPRAADPERQPDALTVTATATSAEGTVFEGPVERGGTRFEAPPGAVSLAFTVHNRAGDAIDRHTRVLPMPDPADAGLIVTTPAVCRAGNPLELRALAGAAPPIHAGRDFERTDRLLILFAVAGAASPDATVSARLLDRRGAALDDLPVDVDPARRGYRIDLPLSTIARGEFVLSIQARHGDDRAEALVPLRIVR